MAAGYKCVLDKRGVRQYRFQGKRVAEADVPNNVMTVLTALGCAPSGRKTSPPRAAKAKARKEEEEPSSESEREEEEIPVPKPTYHRKAPPAMVGMTRGGKEVRRASPTSGLKTSPRRISIAGAVKPRSPAGKGAVGRGGLAKCPKSRPQDYEWLRFYWDQTKLRDTSNNKRLIERFRKEYQQDYPYSDEEEVTA